MSNAERIFKPADPNPIVGILMGSVDTDGSAMLPAVEILEKFDIPHEVRNMSAHRTPEKMAQYGRTALSRGIKIVIAGAGGSAHLQGMSAAFAPRVHVMGVAIVSSPDTTNAAIGSEIRMPRGTPLAFMGINEAGAYNAGLAAAQILALTDEELGKKYDDYVLEMERDVERKDHLLQENGLKNYLQHVKDQDPYYF